jgi:glycogen synthase
MRILMLSWTYPANGSDPLAAALVTQGHDVTVVTRQDDAAPTPLDERVDGVRVIRAAEDLPVVPGPLPVVPRSPRHDLLAGTMAVNHALGRAVPAGERFDVIHAQSWRVAHAAIALKERFRVPLVATMRSTEAGRHQGYLPEPGNRSVHAVEWWLAAEASRVIVPSDYLGWEVGHLFGVPPERIDTVPLGIDAAPWKAPSRAVAAARLRFAGEGPLVVYAGRLAPEKGAQDLLAAAGQLRNRHPGTRFVIAGDGSHRAALIAEARRLKLHRAVSFPGQLDHDTLAAVFGAADAVVLPSRYEASGTIALEAAAAGAPLAVSSIGALASFVEPDVTGLRFAAGDVDAIVEATSELIGDPLVAQMLGARAREVVLERHSYAAVAARSAESYRLAKYSPSPHLPHEQRLVLVPPGNLLAGGPVLPSDYVSDGPDDVFELTALDEMADDAAWAAGVSAAREAVRAEAARRQSSLRDDAERETAARVASDALDVVLAATHRA